MKLVSFNYNELTVKWNNRSMENEVDSGTEVLIRCDETGAGDMSDDFLEE
jgi:hypothetical protein